MAEVHPIPTDWRFQDLTGQSFGHFKVLSFAGPNQFGNSMWNCICLACSKETVIGIGNLKNQKPYKDGDGCRCKKHGASGEEATPEYRAWKSMKLRCAKTSYKRYGGRGIKVCDLWKRSFKEFLEHVGPRPSPKHSLDRFPNMDGNYEPGNVRWATDQQQARNRNSNTVLTHDGKTLLLVEWEKITGIPRFTIMGRITRYGWSVSRALTTPVDTRFRRKSHE